MGCIFCKIINGKIPSYKLYEDDEYIVILDAFPANKGHSLVIPKNHHETIFDIDDKTMVGAYSLVRKTAFAIKEHMGISDINIIQNNGEIAGQTVGHFHIHVVPRHSGDEVVIKSKTVNINDEEKEEIKIALAGVFGKNI